MKKEGVCGMDAATLRPHIVVCLYAGFDFDNTGGVSGLSGEKW
ncbi:hypothetical protein Rcae01_04863 [Novipirellula caenicola]|uniref:Uncharacterized protein n=1 Tax=Novipirellula caenicola TaxID=1536901 RepID=A0ABP9VW37_9BACT